MKAADKAPLVREVRDVLQGVSAAVLAAIVRGDINVSALAVAELDARGLNRAGKWVAR